MLRAHLDQWHTTSGAASVVADRALYRQDNRPQLAHPAGQWSTRVPAPVNAAQTALAQADPQTMTPLIEGDRYHALTSSDGGVEPRWALLDSEARQPQAQRTVNQPWRKPSDQAVQAWKNFCRTTLACAAEAPQALATCEQGWQVTCLNTSTGRATPRAGTRGRLGPGTHPDPVVYHIDGALAASLVVRQALVTQQSGCILAPHAREATPRPPHERLEGSNGQGHAEHGFRFLTDPTLLASSRSLKTPERIMARCMVMTGC